MSNKFEEHFYPVGTRVRVYIRNYDEDKEEIYFGEVVGINKDGYFPKSYEWNKKNQHKKKYKIKLDNSSIEFCYKLQVKKEDKY